ncbi:hypothetical protein D3C80_2210780 [compost metagenome]
MPVKKVVDARQFRELIALATSAQTILLIDAPGNQRDTGTGADTTYDGAIAGNADNRLHLVVAQ